MEDRRRCEIVAVADDLHGGRVKTVRLFAQKVRGIGVAGIKVVACFPEHYATRRLLDRVEPEGGTYRDSLQRLRLLPETLAELREAADGLQLIVAPYDIESVTLLSDQPVDVWQIDLACSVNIPLLESVAAVARRVYYCVWGCSPRQVEKALSIFASADLVLLHSLSYPSHSDLVRDMATLKWLQGLGYPVGLYDSHVDMFPTCLGLEMGARIIEKPLWSNSSAIEPVPDSLQLAQFVHTVRAIERIMQFGPTVGYRPEEMDAIEDLQTALVAARTIPRGTSVTRDMLTVKAPASGLSSELLSWVIGHTAAYDLAEDEPITFGVLA